MKKLLIALSFGLLCRAAYADTKISAMSSTTTLNAGDIIPVVTNPGSSPANFSITKTNLISTLGITAGGGIVSAGTFTWTNPYGINVSTIVASTGTLTYVSGSTISYSSATFTNITINGTCTGSGCGSGGGGGGNVVNLGTQFQIPYYSFNGSSNTFSAYPGVTFSTASPWISMSTTVYISSVTSSSATLVNASVTNTLNAVTENVTGLLSGTTGSFTGYLVAASSVNSFSGNGGNLTNNGLNIGTGIGLYQNTSNGIYIGAKNYTPGSFNSNTCIGGYSCYTNGAQNGMTAVGYQAGYTAGSSANYDTFVGNAAGYSTTSGKDNVCIGHNSCYGTTSGQDNTLIGYIAAQAISDGKYNTGVGSDVFDSLTHGQNNTAIGFTAAPDLTTGVENVCIGGPSGSGQQTCQNIITGSSNTIIGMTGDLNIDNAASGNTGIGYGNGFYGTGAAVNKAIAIGYNVIVGTSNTAMIGAVGTSDAVTVLMSTFTVSSGTVTNQFRAGTYQGGSLATCGDSSHALGWSAGSFNCQAITGGGGSGGNLTNLGNQFQVPYYSFNGSSNTLSAYPGVTFSTNTPWVTFSTTVYISSVTSSSATFVNSTIANLTVSTLNVQGTGGGALYLLEGSSPTTGLSNNDVVWGDITNHWPLFNPNNTSTYSVVGSSQTPTAGHFAKWSASDALADAGAIVGVVNYSQPFTSQTTVTLTHNLSTTSVIVSCYDNSSPAHQIGFDSMTVTDSNNINVAFASSQSGYCVVNAGTSQTIVIGGTGGSGGNLVNLGTQFQVPYYSFNGSSNTFSAYPAVTFSTTPGAGITMSTNVYISTLTVSSATIANISATTFTVTSPGNFAFYNLNTDPSNLYQVVGSSTNPTNGHLAVWSSSWSIIDGGVPGTGSSISGNNWELIVNSVHQSSPTPTMSLVAGTNITLTPSVSGGTTTVTIAASGSSGSPSGPDYSVQVASPSDSGFEGWANFTNNGTTITLVGLSTITIRNVSTQTASGIWFDYTGSTLTVSSLSVVGQVNASTGAFAKELNIPWNNSTSVVASTGDVIIDTTAMQLVAHDGKSAKVIAWSTHSFTVTISSGLGWNGLTLPVWRAPVNSSVTITQTLAESLPTGTTVLYQLDYRSFGSMQTQGNKLYTVAFSTANDGGVSTTSSGFTNTSALQQQSVVLTTPAANAGAGTPSAMTVTVYYLLNKQ